MFVKPIGSIAYKNSVAFLRTFHTSSLRLLPRGLQRTLENDAGKHKDDLDTITEVESNLFAASASRPVKSTLPKLKTDSTENHWPLSKQEKPTVARKETKVKKEPVTSPVLIDPDLGLSYKKLQLNDPLVSKFMLSAKSRKARDKQDQIVTEGRRLILDAINAGLKLEIVLFAQKSHLMEIKDNLRHFKDAQIVRVPQQDLRSWSTLVSCPGVIAIFRKPTENEIREAVASRETLPITVICDNIREPNNLGSIIRSCAAIPCEEVLVTKGCCDPWDTKALRGGCGAQFNIAVYDDLTWEQINKRLIAPDDIKRPLVYLAENNTEQSNKFGVDVIPYDKMQISKEVDRCALVIGGETHGISEEAYRFFEESRMQNNKSGGCLYIPMSEYVNSLNSASAMTLLLFEMRRKLLEDQSRNLRPL